MSRHHRLQASLTGTSTPTGIAPEYIGQIFYDTTGSGTYISYGTGVGDWERFYSSAETTTLISGTLQDNITNTASGTSIIRVSNGDLLIVSNGPTVASQGVVGTLLFRDNNEREAYGSFEIPTNYKDDTDITMEIYFMNDDAQVGTKSVVWGLDYRVLEEGDIYSTLTDTVVSVTKAAPNNAAAGTFMIASGTLSYNDVNNPFDARDHVYFRFYRDAKDGADDLNGNAALTLLIFRYVPEVGV